MESFLKNQGEWLLGIRFLDVQHQDIARHLDLLMKEYSHLSNDRSPKTSTQQAHCRAKFTKLIDDFYLRIKSHFTAEEEFMIREDYPRYSSHAREHMMLLAELKSTHADMLREGCGNTHPDIFKPLKEWFIVHIAHSDREFANYLRARDSHTSATGHSTIKPRSPGHRTARTEDR